MRFHQEHRHRRLVVGACVIALVLAGCGGEGQSSTSESNAQSTITSQMPSESTTTTSNQSGDGDLPTAAGGSAVLTLGDITIEFDSFACYSAEEANQLFGTDDLTFGALGEGSDPSGNEAAIVVSSIDSPFGTNYTVFYTARGPDGEDQWQMVGTDVAEVSNGSVNAEGEFSHIVDNQPSETDVATGSLEATCSSG